MLVCKNRVDARAYCKELGILKYRNSTVIYKNTSAKVPLSLMSCFWCCSKASSCWKWFWRPLGKIWMLLRCVVNIVTSQFCSGLAGWIHLLSFFFYDWDLLEIVCSSPGQRNPQRSCLVKGKDSAEINRNEVGLTLLDLCLVHGTGRMWQQNWHPESWAKQVRALISKLNFKADKFGVKYQLACRGVFVVNKVLRKELDLCILWLSEVSCGFCVLLQKPFHTPPKDVQKLLLLRRGVGGLLTL